MTTRANRALLKKVGADLETRAAVVLAAAIPRSLGTQTIETLRAQLNEADLTRLSEIKAPGGAEAFLVTRAMVRAVLGSELGHPPPEVELSTSERGKPTLAPSSGPPMYFNTSHSRTQAVVAVSRVGDIGVDVEEIGAIDERVVRRSLADEEYGRLAQLPPDERAAAFFRLWTVKEACAKATGVGIGIGMRAVTATLAGRGRWGDYLWESLDLGPGLAAAVAIRRPGVVEVDAPASLHTDALTTLFGFERGFDPEGSG